MSAQFIEIEGKQVVVIPADEYRVLLEKAEMLDDVAATIAPNPRWRPAMMSWCQRWSPTPFSTVKARFGPGASIARCRRCSWPRPLASLKRT